MAKHDELDVGKAKDDFDNITKGVEAEVIELEKPPETDKEFDEATDEELTKEPTPTEDPSDETIKVGIPSAQEQRGDITVEGDVMENHPAHHGEGGDSEVPAEVNSDGLIASSDGSTMEVEARDTSVNIVPTEEDNTIPDIQDDPKTADFGPITNDHSTYAPRGVEFTITLTEGRRDGIFLWWYKMKEDVVYPKGSAEEFVQYLEEGTQSTDINTIKEMIDMAYEDFDDGYTIDNPF